MDQKKAIKIAKTYAERVGQRYPIQKIILFGSYAWGTLRPNSDIDLAIILDSGDDIIDIHIELMKMRTDDHLLIEPHPFFKADFHLSNPLASEILRHGIELTELAA